MKVKRLLAIGGVAAVVALGGASVASATPDLNCDQFQTPVKIVNGYDPNHLDRDGDGVGCEGNAGDPTAYDWYSNLKDEGDSTPQPTQTGELAHTGGWGPVTHPIRWYGVSGALIAAGGIVYIVGKKRSTN